MKLTKQLQATILDVYEAFWCSLLYVDIEIYATIIDQDYRLIGTTEKEVFFTKAEAIHFLKATAEQVAGNIERRKSKIRTELIDGLVFITEQFDAYALVDNDWTFYGKTRVSTWIQQKRNGWKIVQQHFSFPDTKAAEGQSIGLEKISKENLRLREAIQRRTIELENKTRQLEIEASLERVRTVTMGMNKPGDILNICKVFFTELQSLGFKDLRNTLINFWDDKNGQLHDYDYSDYSGGNYAKLAYSSHPAFEEFQKKIRKAKDAFAKLVINKDGLKSWQERRRSSGEYKDPRLNKISALYYYFYSTGVGALGISTFSPISKEEVEVLKKFRNVFDMAYQRYLDIQKSEAQAREVQIELALERVRARTMAMQHSEELLETVTVMFEQFKTLGEDPERMAIEIVNEKENVFEVWATQHGGAQLNAVAKISLDEPYVMQKMYKAWKAKKKSITIDLRGNELEEYFNYLKKAGLPVQRKIFGKRRVQNVATFSKGILTIITPEPRPQETIQLLERFAAVFDGTYTRFLDLQKAEAQAREAEIELALERVRAKSMAMRHSDELAGLVNILFKELTRIGFSLDRCIIMTYNETNSDTTWWLANMDGVSNPVGLLVPNHSHQPYQAYINEWKNQTAKWSYRLGGTEKKKWDRYIFSKTELAALPQPVKQGMQSVKEVYLNVCVNKYASITFSGLEPIGDKEFDILHRFAKVFEQSYTRFLDLQKAETQAREAQIEASLERVRARTMAMHNSEDVSAATATMLIELEKLGVQNLRGGIAIISPDQTQEVWSINHLPDGTVLRAIGVFDMRLHPFWQQIFKAYEQKADFDYYWLAGKDKQDYIAILNATPGYLAQPINEFPDMHIQSYYFGEGIVWTNSLQPHSESDKQLMRRFAAVFSLTFRRYQDLQKAEAQAREAQIELGLERVRARAMAMQKSDELKELIGTVYSELTKLDIALVRCLIWVMDSETLSARLWMANSEAPAQPANFYIPYHKNPPYLAFIKGWKEKNAKWKYDLKGRIKKEWDEYVFRHTEMKYLPEPVKRGMQASERILLAGSFHSFGCLQTAGTEQLKDEHFEILNRFAKVFDLTYTRFNDLKKAEAQAKEAQIELGLERVRARAMAMQHSNELSDLVDTVFKELTKLDFTMTMCIINIIDESTLSNRVWGANPDTGKPPASYYMKFEGYPFHHAMLKGYQERASRFIYVIEGEEKKEYDEYLFNKTEFSKMPLEAQAASKALKKYVVSFTFSNFGGLQTVSEEDMSDEQLGILERFGKVFDLTYTRFNDLQKAEAQAREAQIEAALERVRAASMAMHTSEELKEVIKIVCLQLTLLKINLDHAGFVVDYVPGGDWHFWIADQEDIPAKISHPYFESVWAKQFKEAKATGADFFATQLNFEEKNKFYKELLSYVPGLPEVSKDFYLSCPGLAASTVLLENVGLYIENFSGTPYTEEENSTLLRFGKVFQQTYTRFLDLQKAEAQTRESQIELGLERVRARAMAMQNSDELKELIGTVFIELTKLDLALTRCLIMIYDPQSIASTWWMANSEAPTDPIGLYVKYHEHYPYKAYIKAWKEQQNKWQYILEGKDKNDWDDFLFTETELAQLPDFVIAGMKAPDRVCLSASFNNFGCLNLATLEPLSAEHFDILLRFARVFDLTYTRFNDLKQAEAQAREAKIEAALEKVRSRSLAMHTSDEIKEVVKATVEKIQELDIEMNGGISLVTFDAGSKDMHHWLWIPGQLHDTFKAHLPWFEHVMFYDCNGAREQGLELFAKVYSGKEKDTYFDHLFNKTEFKGGPDEVKTWVTAQPYFGFSFAIQKYSGIFLNDYTGKYFSADTNKILIRFSKVFEQAYVRFLDLQKAEAQAREAKIEMALERVRSRSLAMHSSGELGEVVTVVLNNLLELGYIIDQGGAAHLAIFSEGTKDFFQWSADPALPHPVKSFIPYTDLPILTEFWEARQNGHDFLAKVYSFDEKNAWFSFAFEHSDLKHIPGELKKLLLESETYAHSIAIEKNSAIIINSITGHQLSENQIDILRRFSKVFEQAYIRFLDLQKAEAQARESQIQLALERVRARTMAMQHSNELPDAATLLFHQVQSLGMPAWSAGYCTWDDNKKSSVTLWMSSEGVLQPPFTAPTTEDELFIQMRKGQEDGKGFHVVEMGGDKLVKHYQYMRTLPVVGEILDSIIESGHPLPAFQIMHHAYFSKGFLLFITYEPVPDAHDIFKRFGTVFDQTYTRFLDLQKAEAQAREAKIEAALEKVRSRSLAMHKSDELQEVVNSLFERLTDLDIEMDSANIAIFKEGSRDYTYWIASPFQIRTASFQMPYVEISLTKDVIAARESGTDFSTTSYSFEEKNKWFEYAFEHTDFRFLTEERKAFILQAPAITVGIAFSKHTGVQVNRYSSILVSADDAVILKRFSKVFEQAYIRFLDLQKAEAQAREAQIEAALERVRSKTMAMHNSQDVGVTVMTMFDELVKLGVNKTIRCGIGILKDPTALELWTAYWGENENVSLTLGRVDTSTHPLLSGAANAWKNKKSTFSYELEGEDLINYYTVLNEAPHYPFHIDIATLPSKLIHYDFYFPDGTVFAFAREPLSDELIQIFKRFAAVFGQTYRRYLDLLKAEANAKEAQVESALERVRSKTMAMHNSNDVGESVAALFDELTALGVLTSLDRCGIGIMQPNEMMELWTAEKATGKTELTIGYLNMQYHTLLKNVYQSWVDKKETYHYILEGDDKLKYYEAMNSQTGYKIKKDYYSAHEKIVHTDFFFKEGCLYVFSLNEFTTEATSIFIRFVNVFGQTYRRYLDLQKAEAQAREAQIEAALERVRSRTLAMQKSDELAETAAVLFQQLIALGIEPNRLYISIIKSETGNTEFWITDEDGSKVSTAFAANMNDNPTFFKMYEGWKQQQKSLVIDIQGEELQNYFSHLTRLGVPFKEGRTQKRRVQDIAYFSKGFIGMASQEEQPAETLQLLERFAAVFNLTFTRFNDLKIAEAHAEQAEQDLIAIKEAKQKAEEALTVLQSTQKQLIQSEKMASLGELTAGIAHEIQNPLNFVNNFSEVSKEMLDEMREAIEKGDIAEANEIMQDVIQNLEKINHHGKRADGIVKGMLQHSRSSSGTKEPTDINALTDEYLRLAYHGLRAKDKSFNATLKTDYDQTIGTVQLIPQDIGRVVLNLITNAFHAVGEKKKENIAGYEPVVSVRTSQTGDKVEVSVQDNGNGIPSRVLDKIFQPFFTTKPTGEGTGLGLSLAYDIVKAHGGELKVETKEGEGSTFIIQIPTN